MNNTTVSSIRKNFKGDLKPDLTAWCVAFGTLAVLIISGNALAIAVLTRKRLLSRRTSYFLLSLSVADLLVGLLSVPTFIFQLLTFMTSVTPTVETIVNVVKASDVFCSLASTFTLTIIALERFYAITFPLQHRVSDKKMYYILVSTVWILAGVLSSLYFLNIYKLLDHKVFFYFMMITFFLSLFVMLIAYLTIWFRVTRTITLDKHKHSGSMSNTESNPEEKLREDDTELALKPLAPKKRQKPTIKISKNGKTLLVTNTKDKDRMRSRAESEKKLAVTLFIVTAVFVVTWLPFQVINLFYFTCGLSCPTRLPMDVIYFCKFLNYTNSLLNPVVYSLRLPEFRYVLKNIVFKKFKFLFCLD